MAKNQYILTVFIVLIFASFIVSTTSSSPKCTIFSFGDSNSDVGSGAAATGFDVTPPNGQSFFTGTTGRRVCDGRLYIDFICEKLNMSMLSPYLESSGSTFYQGASFAVSGSLAEDRGLIPLSAQIRQFRHFLNRTLDLLSQGKGSMLTKRDFRNAVYIIDIGQNDLYGAFAGGSSFGEIVTEKIPLFLAKIRDSIVELYNHGSRKFLLNNVGPVGCMPTALVLGGNIQKDEAGCIIVYNDGAKHMNYALKRLASNLTVELEGSIVVYSDIYAMKYDIIANATRFGFEFPMMACCGHGGPPYNSDFTWCGMGNATVCLDPSRRISWDGIHYTQAANAFVADMILSGNYTAPRLNFELLCHSVIDFKQ